LLATSHCNGIGDSLPPGNKETIGGVDFPVVSQMFPGGYVEFNVVRHAYHRGTG